MAIANYTAKEWKNGDVLYATALNNIENQLEDLTNEVQGYDTEFSVPEVLSANSDGITMATPVTFEATAITTMNAPTTIEAATTINGTTIINAATTITESLVASKNVTLGNTTSEGAATSNHIYLKAPVIAYSDLTVHGTTTCEGTVILGSATTINNIITYTNATLNANTTINGELTTSIIKFPIANGLLINDNSDNLIIQCQPSQITFKKPILLTYNNSITSLSNNALTTETITVDKLNINQKLTMRNDTTTLFYINYTNNQLSYRVGQKSINTDSTATFYTASNKFYGTIIADKIEIGSNTEYNCNFIKGQVVLGFYDSITSSIWDKSNAYAIDDTVFYNNSYYKCNTAETSGTDWNNAHWDLINTYLEVVGNGTVDDTDPDNPITHTSNARTLDISGNEILAGSLTAPTGIFNTNLTVGVATEHTQNDVTTTTYAGSSTFNTLTNTFHGTTTIDHLNAWNGTVGLSNEASTLYSFAIGQTCHATGACALAVGHSCTAQGNQSVAIGHSTIAVGPSSFVFGQYNIQDSQSSPQYIEIVGNGTNTNAVITRNNARTLDWQGNEWLAGQLTATSLIIGTATTNNDTTTYNGTTIFNTSSNILHGNTNIDELTVNGAINAIDSFMLSNDTIDYRLFIQNSGLASFYAIYNNTSYQLFSYQPDDSVVDPVDTINFGGLTPRSVSYMNLHAVNEITLQSNQTICYGNFKIYNNTLTFSAANETDVTLTKADIEAIKTYCGLTNNS